MIRSSHGSALSSHRGVVRAANPSVRLERSLWRQGYLHVAGVDEAGRGPLAGPVVAAAVVFRPGKRIAGVRDSKLLGERDRERLYAVIMEEALSVGVGVVGHSVIDEVNILQASMMAMSRALDCLSVAPDMVLVDGPVFRHATLPFRTIVDGDALVFSIAAASIVAKVTRDRTMREFHELYPEYGFARHKGYPTRQHLDAIRMYGLSPIHRKSFRHPVSIVEPGGGAGLTDDAAVRTP